jgi:hypothetical protein
MARALVPCVLAAGLCFTSLGANPAQQDTPPASGVAPSLKETRLVMEKWIETQQIISKERNDWQQGKEILLGRLELMRKEIGSLREKIKETEKGLTDNNAKREGLLSQEDDLKATSTELTQVITSMEGEVRRLFKSVPDWVQSKLQPLHQRIPEDPDNTRASLGERFQNVLGILTELNKVSTELNVTYEVRDLGNGKPTEVRALYVGLTQAYYVSAQGEAGVGHPTPDGWKWEPSKAIASDVTTALEIIQGKHSPAFVPLPVKLP